MLAPQQGKREPAGAVRRRGALAQQRGAGELELVQLGEDHRPRLLRRRLDHRAHAGDQPGVDAIGLGVGADRLGEAPDAGRVQLRTGNIGVVQRPLEGGMIGAGRLEGDACDLRADPADEPPVPGRVVGDPAGLAARPAAGVEMVFGDVHADGRLHHLFRCPMLVMRASRSVSVRVSGRTRGDLSFHRPLRVCSHAIRPLAAAGGWQPSGGHFILGQKRTNQQTSSPYDQAAGIEG